MLSGLTRSDRDELARRHIESAEAWMRRAIDERLTNAHGPAYATLNVLPAKVRKWIAVQMATHPGKFPRTVDATSMEQAIEVLIHPDLYDKHFKALMSEAYPDSREEAKTFLTRIRNIRNDIAHGRGCSLRSLEQAICYSNDFISSVSSFYKGLGMSNEFDVPLIVRFVDNIGNENHLVETPLDISRRIIDLRAGQFGDIRPGQELILEVEIDSSFDRASYTVSSRVLGRYTEGNKVLRFIVENSHVGEQFEIIFTVITDRDWHRQWNVDDQLRVVYRVLPPI